MTDEKKHIKWIDTSKGLLMILVIVGHSHVLPIVDQIINSFHMAAFFILSGYTLHYDREFKNLVNKILGGVIIQYIIFSSILLIYDFFKFYFLSSGEFDIVSGLLSIVVPISGRESTSVYGLWFLPTLCLAKIISFVILKYRKWSVFAGVSTIVICLAIHRISGVVSIISLLPFSVFYILFGAFLKKYYTVIKNHKVIIAIISLFIFFSSLSLNILFSECSFDFSSLNLGIIPLYMLTSLVGSLLIIIISMFLEKFDLINSIGKDSLYFYGLHYEVIGLVNKIFSNGVLVSILTLFGTFPVVWIYKRIYKIIRCEKKSD